MTFDDASKRDADWRKALIARYEPSVWPQIEVGDGWRPLIEFLYDEVDESDCISVGQVKEKFGTLCFYLDHDYECRGETDGNCSHLARMYRITSAIESLSGYMCEQCGARSTKPPPLKEGERRGWIHTECDDCRHTRLEERERQAREWEIRKAAEQSIKDGNL